MSSYINQYALEGMWLKGNTHCDADRHIAAPQTNISVCQWYRRHGFDFVAVRHTPEQLGSQALEGNFIPVLGEELHPGHLVVLGIGEQVLPDVDQRRAHGDTLEETTAFVKEIRRQGGIAIIAHPFWTGWGWPQLTELMNAGVQGFEVTSGDWRKESLARANQIYKMLLSGGYRPAAIGADDSHGLGDELAGKAWTGVLAGDHTSDGILAAIRTGRTYAS
jgi:predicted metal-dependent phosphoesterase TrpH